MYSKWKRGKFQTKRWESIIDGQKICNICPPLIQSFDIYALHLFNPFITSTSYSMPNTEQTLISATLWEWHYYCHFTDRKTESWRLQILAKAKCYSMSEPRCKGPHSTHWLRDTRHQVQQRQVWLATGVRGYGAIWSDSVPWVLGWEKFGWVWHWISAANLCNQVSPKFPISCSAQDTSAETDVESRAA